MKLKNKVLIVEDEVIYSMLLKRELTDEGINVCGQVTSGEEALKFISKEKPDIILMDIRLAGNLDGIETVEKILKKYKPKIIFMTGYAVDETKKKAMKLNPAAFLEKPLKIKNIIALLNKR